MLPMYPSYIQVQQLNQKHITFLIPFVFPTYIQF